MQKQFLIIILIISCSLISYAGQDTAKKVFRIEKLHLYQRRKPQMAPILLISEKTHLEPWS